MKAKKFGIIALVLAIALLIAPISESKAEEELDVKTSGDYEYIVLDDGTAYITHYNGNDEKVIIPEKLDGIRVTGIWDYAFWDKTNLKEITISDSVESIGINPFAQCKNLLNINISANHPTLFFIDNALFYKPEKKIVSYLSASEESKYEIPKGIKIIGDEAFFECKNLEEIKIPDSVQLLGDRVFSGCDNLKKINIPDSVQSIGNSAFFKCTNLTEIKILNGVQSIGDSAFSLCNNLTEINIPDGVQSIGDRAFSFCINLTEITIPNSVENIGENPFYECGKLLNVNISADHPTLEFIDNALIYKPEKKIVSYLSASKESKYEIPDGIESIGEWAFSECINLTEIKIPDSVQSIGDLAFKLCINLTEINIPDSVQSIGEGAFSCCKNIKKINIPASVKTIGENAFKECDNIKITVAKDSYAEKYCQENNINHMYEDSWDWLKN